MSAIRVRACVAVVDGDRVLAVPHYNTDAGPVQWHLPGGAVTAGAALRAAAEREAREETGLAVAAGAVLAVTEVIDGRRDWHSVTVTFAGRVVGGALRAEPNHARGAKLPRWLSRRELDGVPYHPREAVDVALPPAPGVGTPVPPAA